MRQAVARGGHENPNKRTSGGISSFPASTCPNFRLSAYRLDCRSCHLRPGETRRGERVSKDPCLRPSCEFFCNDCCSPFSSRSSAVGGPGGGGGANGGGIDGGRYPNGAPGGSGIPGGIPGGAGGRGIPGGIPGGRGIPGGSIPGGGRPPGPGGGCCICGAAQKEECFALLLTFSGPAGREVGSLACLFSLFSFPFWDDLSASVSADRGSPVAPLFSAAPRSTRACRPRLSHARTLDASVLRRVDLLGARSQCRKWPRGA